LEWIPLRAAFDAVAAFLPAGAGAIREITVSVLFEYRNDVASMNAVVSDVCVQIS